MSYFPLDRDLLTSSCWAQGTPEQIKVWLYLLLAADPRTGVVDDADPAIALRCGLSVEAATAAVDWLAAPDPHSRTKDHDGRRLERLEGGGVRILNYLARRDRDHSTARVRRWRERRKAAAGARCNAGNGVSGGGNGVAPVSATLGNDGHGNGHEHEHEHERPDGTERPPESLEPEGDEPEREELLVVCRPLASKLRTTLTAVIEKVSAIPAGNGYAERHFSDPRAKGVSIEWVRAALARAHALRAEAERPLPL